MTDCVLALDIGTSGARALLVTAGGVVASASSRSYPLETPQPGWAEQSPLVWWEAVSSMVRELLARDPCVKERIACIGLSGQMHGTVCLDKTNQIIRPCMLWCDARASTQVETLRTKLSTAVQKQVLANPILAGFPAPKLLWLKEREPDGWHRIARLMLPKDYIRFRLTGEISTDVSDASGTLLFDPPLRRWSTETLAALDLDESVMPPVHDSMQVTGQVSRKTAEQLGLREGTPVIAGAGDAIAATVGTGVLSAGKALSVLGTGGNVTVFAAEPAADPGLRLNLFCGCIPGSWVLLGVQQSAGLSLRWLRDGIQLYAREIQASRDQDPYDLMLREASRIPPGSSGVVFLPYLMGERTPHMDPDARGAFVGLSARHTRAHLVRAVLEGVAFAMRDTLEIVRRNGIPVSEVLACGGGARSSLWLQLLADVFGSPVSTLNLEEGSAAGTALLACVAAGFFGSAQEACNAALKRAATYQPQPEAVRAYDEVYGAYRRLYPALKASFHELSEIEKKP